MRDDGVDYLRDLVIVLPDQVDNVAQELAAIQQSAFGEDSGGGKEADSRWQDK